MYGDATWLPGPATVRPTAVDWPGKLTVRQAAFDPRKLRGQRLALKPGRSRRYQIPDDAVRVIVGLLTLRDDVIGCILAGVRSPRMGRKPATWTDIDRYHETIRIGMQTLFCDLAIETHQTA